MTKIISIRTSRFALTHEHRGGLASDPESLWPARDLIERAGGERSIEKVIDDLYQRIERDPELSRVFPHFQTSVIKSFFVTSLGGRKPFVGTSSLGPFHRGTTITPSLAVRWIKHMKAALMAADVEADVANEILNWLQPLAKQLVNTSDQSLNEQSLSKTCRGVQTRQFTDRINILRAAGQGRWSTVRSAVAHDPEVLCFRDADGRSILWEAVYRNRVKLIEYLIEQGANVNLPGCDPSVINLACSGNAKPGTAVPVTSWALSTLRCSPRISELIESAGGLDDVFSAAWRDDVEILDEALRQLPTLVNAEDPAEDFKRITPLHHAIAGGSFAASDLLIKQGARVEPHSRWLLTHAALLNRVDLVELLLDNGADVHESGIIGPLDREDRPVADLLVARGFDINADSSFGALLVRACRADVSNHETSRIRTLLEYGADVNQSRNGLTALHYATRSGRLPLIQMLLDHGADIHRRDHDGLTPLAHLTKTRARIDPIPVLELLVDHGADVDSRNDKGETILFFFSRRGNQQVVAWLVDHGANTGITNRAGRTALDAIRKKSGETMEATRALLSGNDQDDQRQR